MDERERSWWWITSRLGTVGMLTEECLTQYRQLRMTGTLQSFDVQGDALLLAHTHLLEAERALQIFQGPPKTPRRSRPRVAS